MRSTHAQRVQALEQAFVQIALTRMHGVPLLHPALRVQAVGFALAACRTLGSSSENGPQRGLFLPDLQAHSPAMGQKDGKKCTAAAHLQPTIPKSDRLPGDGEILLGVLVTPWFMNLVRLPASTPDPVAGAMAVGQRATHAMGDQTFDFIGAWEESIGAYEACSLFSPMFGFADQAATVATAHEVLNLLRAPPRTAASATAGVAAPGRRGFLFGRSAKHRQP